MLLCLVVTEQDLIPIHFAAWDSTMFTETFLRPTCISFLLQVHDLLGTRCDPYVTRLLTGTAEISGVVAALAIQINCKQ